MYQGLFSQSYYWHYVSLFKLMPANSLGCQYVTAKLTRPWPYLFWALNCAFVTTFFISGQSAFSYLLTAWTAPRLVAYRKWLRLYVSTAGENRNGHWALLYGGRSERDSMTTTFKSPSSSSSSLRMRKWRQSTPVPLVRRHGVWSARRDARRWPLPRLLQLNACRLRASITATFSTARTGW